MIAEETHPFSLTSRLTRVCKESFIEGSMQSPGQSFKSQGDPISQLEARMTELRQEMAKLEHNIGMVKAQSLRKNQGFRKRSRAKNHPNIGAPMVGKKRE